jgi:hypothetical protein
MALYKNPHWLTKTDDAAFDKIFKPGAPFEHSGIYRCIGCGREVVREYERTMPPQNHHLHSIAQGEVCWKMAVYCDPREE